MKIEGGEWYYSIQLIKLFVRQGSFCHNKKTSSREEHIHMLAKCNVNTKFLAKNKTFKTEDIVHVRKL